MALKTVPGLAVAAELAMDGLAAATRPACTLGTPNYDAARFTTDPDDFRVDQIGCALVEFRFPPGTLFPCLRVDAGGRGLIFPLSGESYATAPEIVLARRLGAEITILYGVVIPWKSDGSRPFSPVIADFIHRRDQAKKSNDAV